MRTIGALLILLIAAVAVESSNAAARIYFQELYSNGTIAIWSSDVEGHQLKLHVLVEPEHFGSIPFAVVDNQIFAALAPELLEDGYSLVVFTEQGRNKTLLKDMGDIRGLTADPTGRLWWLKCIPRYDVDNSCERVELWFIDPMASRPKPVQKETLDNITNPIAFAVNSHGELALTDFKAANESVIIARGNQYTYTGVVAGGIAVDDNGTVFYVLSYDFESWIFWAMSSVTRGLCTVDPTTMIPPLSIALDSKSKTFCYPNFNNRGLNCFGYDPLSDVRRCGKRIFKSAHGVVAAVTVNRFTTK